MSGVNGCWGGSWSEECDGKELCGALGGGRDLELRGGAVWNIVDPCSTTVPHITLFVFSCFGQAILKICVS